MDARPNIVLVHGAWADGSSWSRVIERLQAAGYHVTAPQFPLTALPDDVARLRHVLALQDGPTIVAGHSYGGQIITALGTDAPNVAGLVYIAAFGLDHGESLGALLSQGPTPPALEHMFTDSRGFGWLSQDDFVKHFAADVDPARAMVMHAVQQPRRLHVHRRDGRARLEVTAVVVPGRDGGRGDPPGRGATVRLPHGGGHRRSPRQPRRHGLPPGRSGPAHRDGGRKQRRADGLTGAAGL
jgi:pimeloyl-ACP methyl ester carboxylesterase